MSVGQAKSPLSHPLQPQPFATHLFLIQPSTKPQPHTLFVTQPFITIYHTHSLVHGPPQPSTTHTLCHTILQNPPPIHTLCLTAPTPSTIHTLFCNGSHNPSPDALFVIKPSLTLHQTQYLSRVSP